MRFEATEGLRVLDLGDEAVVFHPLSWDAHLLNSAASAVLDLLAEAPRSEHEVATFLASALLPEEQGSAVEHARQLLADLRSIGLARPVSGDFLADG